jgi:N-acetylneuraminic acid mutarotase
MKRKALALILMLSFLFSTSSEVVAVASIEENTWETLTPLPESSEGNRAAAANGKIYVMSGSRNFEYDPKTDKWSIIPPSATPRAYFAIAVVQNKIYTIGGSWGNEYTNTNEVYDPSIQEWKNLSPIPANISGFNANVVNGKIYVIGGATYQNPLLSINLVYDIANDAWTNKTAMPYPATAYASSVVDNKIYIMGGLGYLPNRGGVLWYNYTQIYDPETDSWSLGAPMPTHVHYAAAGATIGVMAPKRIYVIGGTTGEGGAFASGTDLTQVYDPMNNTWVLGEPMAPFIFGFFGEPISGSRFSLTVAVLNDQIYAIGGSNQMIFAPPPYKVNQRYTPFGYGTPDPTYDDEPPEITLESPKNETYYSSSIPLQFIANEHIPWAGYKLDNENIIDISGNTTISELTVGSHTLTIYSIDIAGNNGVSKTISFSVAEFPFVPVIAIVVVVACVGLLLYFKKRKH